MVALVRTSYESYTEPELELEGDAALTAIDGNDAFKEAQPLVGKAKEIAVKFKDARKKAANGDREWIAIRNDLSIEYRNILRRIAFMVNALWAGNRSMLLKSGMPLVKEKSEKEQLGVPSTPEITYGAVPESLCAAIESAPGSKVVTFMCAPAPVTKDSLWIRKPGNKKKCTFNNLATGTKYCFKVESTGKDGEQLYSEAVSFWTKTVD